MTPFETSRSDTGEASPRTAGQPDSVHFEFARANDFILLTKDPDDFEELHSRNPNHPGILAVYQDNDPTRDMKDQDIVRAISNIEAAGIELRGGFHVLNKWRFKKHEQDSTLRPDPG